MLDNKEFDKIRQELDDFDKKREELIQLSREVIMLSKRVIYAVHRDDMKSASQALKEIEAKKAELDKKNITLDTNMNKTAYQEYVEAACFYYFQKDGKMPSKKTLNVDTESFLLGLCDLTGELMRKGVNSVINKKYQDAIKIKDLVDEIYGQFLQFNLRNSELRQKSDQIKWNLKKLEEVAYELHMKGMIK